MEKKAKGSEAELAVAARLVADGWHVLFPFGDYSRYDLVAERGGVFCRVQVKYVTPKNGALEVNCRSSNNWSVKPYTKDEIDFIAAYDPEAKNTYFIPVAEIGAGTITLRLKQPRSSQTAKVRQAEDYFQIKVPVRGPVSALDNIGTLG